MTQLTLFTDVQKFYKALLTAISQAQTTVHMAYYAFDDGRWAWQIGQSLQQKAAQGVQVHLLVDEFGLYLDNVKHGWRNRQLLQDLRVAGVHVNLFRPHGKRLSQFNRLHCKFCTIDGHIAFLGGSNIGDHYPEWRDSNLRIVGEVGGGLVQLFDYLQQFNEQTPSDPQRLPELQVANLPLLLTVPGQRQDIRRALLTLVLSAKTAVTLRSWYFLPDKEICNALLSQAENGVHVTILFSHRTRVPVIDAANRPLVRRLSQAGAHVYRYIGRYMHAKEAWNDQGDILFGSANIDRWALCSNFESCLSFSHLLLAAKLQTALVQDLPYCWQAGEARWRKDHLATAYSPRNPTLGQPDHYCC